MCIDVLWFGLLCNFMLKNPRKNVIESQQKVSAIVLVNYVHKLSPDWNLSRFLSPLGI